MKKSASAEKTLKNFSKISLCIITHFNFAAYSFFGNLHNKSTHLGKSNSRMLAYNEGDFVLLFLYIRKKYKVTVIAKTDQEQRVSNGK